MDIVSKGDAKGVEKQKRTREFDQITSSTNELPHSYENHSILLFEHRNKKLTQEH